MQFLAFRALLEKSFDDIEAIDKMNFAALDLNLVRVLDALLREGSTVKAGEKLGMSQSAVSGALSRLRYALDDQLFVRHGHGLRPTDYARDLAIPLRETLDRLEATLSGASFDPKSASITFKLSGSDFFAEMLMPRLAREVHERAPGIRVQLVDLVPNSYIESLERYEADMALIPAAELPDWSERRPLFRSSFVTIARKGNVAIEAAGIKAGETLPIELFCDLGHILFSPEGKTKAMGDAALAKIGRSRNVVMTVPVFFGVCRAVGESDHIALVPRQLAERLADLFGFALYAPPMQLPPALIVGVWHKRSTGNPAHRWIRNLIAEILLPLNVGEQPLPNETR
ncbi:MULTISPECIES: LysR family transcriptional regulator [unclassified Rhizobium]|uniref:LysR family transcriptional regulator n=1 Tax=unclassified Rhizobium TaxID=2613769 RepID=UPI0018023695|nr:MULTISPECIES: LysR family transcriptional regulator [unclassified Rhizobium]MBB3289146.1 DNA-binding transcriptional LysR family regulator [Rhizobium sp. BK252]MBB3403888.1 DNA-binding transcriptional LysR family regulator [Rhizobium sp. BK289]MBB3416443.1 DNA-binding transcriptional LysR family regulator [Rhizobium sp. BK284]MBB3484351.1 DNA-binding transcriptional LysR family regulator [Rhizobium sp. BK347]MDK4718006.1 LysR family transcriptional regulator [Rhizobium sp. CNPSo 3968]